MLKISLGPSPHLKNLNSWREHQPMLPLTWTTSAANRSTSDAFCHLRYLGELVGTSGTPFPHPENFSRPVKEWWVSLHQAEELSGFAGALVNPSHIWRNLEAWMSLLPYREYWVGWQEPQWGLLRPAGTQLGLWDTERHGWVPAGVYTMDRWV